MRITIDIPGLTMEQWFSEYDDLCPMKNGAPPWGLSRAWELVVTNESVGSRSTGGRYRLVCVRVLCQF